MNWLRSLFDPDPHDIPSAIRALKRGAKQGASSSAKEALAYYHACQLLEDWVCTGDGAKKLADWLIYDSHPEISNVLALTLRKLAVDKVGAACLAIERIANSNHPQWQGWAAHIAQPWTIKTYGDTYFYGDSYRKGA